jgi:nicotinic acid phosphoribosyltransferase
MANKNKTALRKSCFCKIKEKNMFKTNPLMLIDFYKAVHEEQYPEGTERIVSYYTPRKSRLDDKYCLVHFGLQYFLIEYLIDWFDNEFFRKPIDKIREDYERYVESSIPDENELFPKIEALHKLGYLPLEIKSLPEGTIIPMGVPCVQITNTHKDFAWVVNTVESLLSNTLWHSQIAASVGYWYRQIVNEYYDLTVDDDVPRAKAMSLFSYRGEESNESGILSSAGWLTSFVLSATVPSAQFMENYYNANVENEEVNFGAVSTEHSVMCSNYAVDGDEITMVKRLLNDIYPNTSFSMVADSYDYWNMVDNILPQCKEDIMRHNGKMSVRPDCYDDKTQILTDKGWKYFRDLNTDDLVAQHDFNNNISFVKPLKYVSQQYDGEMYYFESKKNKLNICVTPNHRMVVDKNKEITIEYAENVKYYTGKNMLVGGKLIGECNKLSPYERLMIAFQADGRCRGINKTEQFEKGYTLEFSIAKKRKIERLESIINECGLEYKKVQTESDKMSKKNKNWKDRYTFYIKVYEKPYKYFSEWIDLTNKSYLWCKDFVEEVVCWDGSIRKDLKEYYTYYNTSKEDAELVQLIAALAGYQTTFNERIDNRKERYKNTYEVSINKKRNCIGGDSIKKSVCYYKGLVYCVQVPTGMLVLRRGGHIFISGNSGDPAEIAVNTVFRLWKNFGGTVNSKGYKVLDPHIGVVYGDSITLLKAKEIYYSLERLGFSANNVSLGAGSFSMQCLEEVVIEEPTKFETQALQPFTRDTYCSAVKATYCEVNGEPIPIYKDPKTDDGHFKKSHKGCCVVTEKADGGLMCIDGLTYEDACSWKGNLLETVYQNSSMVRRDSLSYIRNRLHEGKF